MKVYKVKRGHGKTTRLIYRSEFTGTPILCVDENHKKLIQDIADQNDAKIPVPITINDLSRIVGSNVQPDYLLDEATLYLKAVISKLSSGKLTNPLAITLSEQG